MIKYDVIIIDDERLAREEIKRYLANHPCFNIAGEAANADEGKILIHTKKPQLIFLDIQMPEKDGFDLLDELTVVPHIIFTTAFSEFATKAFDVNALDYLVKPIRAERFLKSIERAINALAQKEQSLSKNSVLNNIFIKDGKKCHFIPISDIRYIESLENYAQLYFNKQKAMIKKSLNSIEEKLDQTVFFRINRSQIININFIKTIHPSFKNKLKIVLNSGEVFDVSSRQSVRFKNWNSL